MIDDMGYLKEELEFVLGLIAHEANISACLLKCPPEHRLKQAMRSNLNRFRFTNELTNL
jgi:hypothetical protein